MILQLISNKWLRGFGIILIFVIWSGICYRAGMNSETVKSELKYAKEQNAALENIVATERDAALSANKIALQYQVHAVNEDMQTRGLNKEILHDKEIIQRDNVIKSSFVRIIQHAEAMPTHAAIARESSTADSTIPADRVLHYTVELRQAFDKCRLQNNAVIDLYNGQLNIINH